MMCKCDVIAVKYLIDIPTPSSSCATSPLPTSYYFWQLSETWQIAILMI